MAKHFTFKSKDLSDDEVKHFTKEMGTSTKLDLTVTRDVKYAAQNKLIDMATRMMIETKRPHDECLKFVTEDRANAGLFRISQLPIADRERDADVDCN
jgi:hypothetical protein